MIKVFYLLWSLRSFALKVVNNTMKVKSKRFVRVCVEVDFFPFNGQKNLDQS